MSNQQLSISELLLSLDSPDLQEAEQVRAAVNQQLSTDRGCSVLSSLVELYLDSSSSQVVLLLSSIREPHHKTLLEKLNEALIRPGSRLAGLTLLGHLIRKQPPWVHHISHSALLVSLLRCLKTETDVVVLITGVLVLITLLPMIPQAGKQHIYDFFDIFGRLAFWSYKNPGHVPMVHLVHLHAGVYSLFHRLYGMFPCNFMSYLRLHYSMKENLDTFHEVIKPMLEHVRVHPELVTGTQDYELDPSRWRCYEVHDIIIQCSRMSLDPLESSCEEDMYLSLRDPHLDLTSSVQSTETISSSGRLLLSDRHQLSTLNNSYIQADDVTWSPSSQCGLSTPPPDSAAAGSAPPLSRTASISGVTACPSSAVVSVASLTEGNQDDGMNPQVRLVTELKGSTIQPITEKGGSGCSDVINDISEDIIPQQPSSSSSSQPVLVTSTPGHDDSSPASALPISLCFTPPHPSRLEEGGSAPSAQSPALPYGPLFELVLPRAATQLISRMTQEVLGAPGEEETAAGREGEDREEEQTSVSPLEVLDQLIVHGHDAHQHLSRRWSAVSRSGDRSPLGGKQQSMKTKGSAHQGEELQCLRSQLLLVHSHLQYERFKRQQHAIRNRRLLRRVISATALEEHSVAMKGQLSVQEEELRSLRSSLEEEYQRYSQLQQDTHTHTEQLHTHIQQLLLQHLDEQRDRQRLEIVLQECQSRLRDLEVDLQRANNKADNAEHQLTQLSLKLCSSEQLQQQMFLVNQQLVILRETNRTLREHLEGTEMHTHTEASMLQCTVGNEVQRLKDSDSQHRLKLEAANHRTAELETQLAKRDQLILDQKKLLEDTKTQSRGELAACEARCVALRQVAQMLQTETLHLYSQIQVDTPSQPQDVRQNGGRITSPAPQGSHKPRPSFSSSDGLINGGVEMVSTSPLHLPSCPSPPLSLSPIGSPLAVGSFLEQHSRLLFRPTSHSQEEEEQQEEEEKEEEEEEEEQPESPPLGQEAESLLAGSPQTEPPNWAAAPNLPPSGPPAPPTDLTLAVRQRRLELSIMDYDETLPEY